MREEEPGVTPRARLPARGRSDVPRSARISRLLKVLCLARATRLFPSNLKLLPQMQRRVRIRKAALYRNRVSHGAVGVGLALPLWELGGDEGTASRPLQNRNPLGPPDFGRAEEIKGREKACSFDFRVSYLHQAQLFLDDRSHVRICEDLRRPNPRRCAFSLARSAPWRKSGSTFLARACPPS